MSNTDTKEQRILNAATKQFALNGYGSTRMDKIADEAQVNKATIYYKIGDKSALYEKVYTVMLDALIEELSTACKDSENPKVALQHYVDTFARHCEKNVFMSRIVLREVASQGQHLSKSPLMKMQQVRNILSDIIHKGIENKVFNPTNPYLIHMLIIGFLNFYSAGKPIRDKVSDLDDNQKHYNILSTAEAGQEISQLILNSISTD